jgi:hypothetical protein
MQEKYRRVMNDGSQQKFGFPTIVLPNAFSLLPFQFDVNEIERKSGEN